MYMYILIYTLLQAHPAAEHFDPVSLYVQNTRPYYERTSSAICRFSAEPGRSPFRTDAAVALLYQNISYNIEEMALCLFNKK